MRKCYRCQQKKNLESFYKGKYECKPCHKESHKRYRDNNREHFSELYRATQARQNSKLKTFVVKYLLQHQCIDCGIKDPLVLEFDHVRGTKVDGVMALLKQRISLKKLQEEISKCEVRCRNCHQKRHYLERDSWLVRELRALK